MNRKGKLLSIDPEDVIIFDTETTGINVGGDRQDEILSLAVMNLAGDVLFNDRFKPSKRKRWPKAEGINGISPAMVKDKQAIEERKDEIEPIFKAAKLYVAYNAEFDLGFLRAAGLDIPERQTFDVMKEFAKVHGEWNEHFEEWSWCKLEDCAAYYDYRDFGAHDALADVKATAHCYKALLDDSLFGEPRRHPKRVEDEFGESYLDYGDEEYRDIVSGGYAASTAKHDAATKSVDKQATEQKPETRSEAEKQLRKANPALVAIGILCAVVGFFIATAAPIVGVPILALGVLIAFVAKGGK